jgi:hypothetical protein
MSMNRPRSRQRPPRSLTLPAPLYDSPSSSFLPQDSSSTVAASALSSADLNLSSYLPSMEESLQDWLARNIPDTANNSPSSLSSLLHEACPCCGKHDCEHMETLYKTMRKLESDTRLAAGKPFYHPIVLHWRSDPSILCFLLKCLEIGQGLLHKHESLVAETNQTKEVLEEQVTTKYGTDCMPSRFDTIKDGPATLFMYGLVRWTASKGDHTGGATDWCW